ncbi:MULTISPECIES: mandelate racemase/muconate lactonizing enzyme family protein [Enterocloster]|uniref:Galactonate dehydratase n=2 Tax=Enterocloster lavalensis TaxID=460384 RepID=A0A1I0KAY3_9FIRM|nr:MULTISPECIES: mandelate racemase/muconate lactonizing enzyme family protein [Enterocloster]MDR3756217.1 mandelate racemase/muconate lactonizing enzyme family protein [Enterocloster sp.]PST32239.1 mandelate racemase/muconate lactonizing enzyme family protein [Enterocloster lavalensis]SEU21345.1 galactonate dehydratase [Enterocloster lavalensis]
MKITGIEPILAGGRYLFVKVHTDEGLVGLGECGAWAYQEATVSVLKQMEKMILGQDPLRTEFIWNALSRNLHFRGSVTQSALSGIDIALWDLKGKYFQVPCYELMGGKVREKIKIYVNARARDARGMAAEAKKLADQGFQSIRFSIGHPKDENGRCGENFTSLVTRVEGIMKAVRDAVGWNVDVAIECHRGMRPAEAIELGRVLRPYRPYFYEDPIPDNLEAMRQVIRGCDIPVATGERFINPAEFDSLMTTTDVRYIRPDMCVSGGLTAGKKIAAEAEVRGVYVIPHNPLGPVSTAACLQLDACIPNFEVQEYPMANGVCRLDKEMKTPFHVENGYIRLPEGPGLGIELIDDIDTVFPFQGSYGGINLHEDGSVVDR